MPSAEENLYLCFLIICQKMVDGQLQGIDWEEIAGKIGLDKGNAANLRWRRLRKEITDNGGMVPVKAAKGEKGAKKTTTPKAKVPKAVKDPNATPTKPKRTPKKRKIEETKDEEDEDGASKSEVDELTENAGQGYKELDAEEEDSEA